MMRLGVDRPICGLSELRLDGQGHFTTLDGHTIVYSGRLTQSMSGVAVSIHRKIAGALVGYEPISDRVLVVRLEAKPRNITLIHVYGTTTTATGEEMERFYQDLSQAVIHYVQVPKGGMLLVMGLLSYEHDSSTIRARFGYNTLRDAYDSSTNRARYNILRGVMCFRAIMNMSILSRFCRML